MLRSFVVVRGSSAVAQRRTPSASPQVEERRHLPTAVLDRPPARLIHCSLSGDIGPMITRRDFLRSGVVSGAAILPLQSSAAFTDPKSAADRALATADPSPSNLEALPSRIPIAATSQQPWQKHVRRVGQTNMTEHDPTVMDIDAWAGYWHSVKADIVFVSVTGILAFYPSKVPFHRHGKFLNNRDFFGECVAAAKKRGMRVVARMSPDLNWDVSPSPRIPSGRQGPQRRLRPVKRRGTLPSKPACSRLIWMTTSRPSSRKSTRNTTWIASALMDGRPWAACRNATASSAPIFRRPQTPAYWRAFTDRVLFSVDLLRRARQREEARQLLFRQLRRVMCAAVPTSTASAKPLYGFKPTTRAAAGKSPPSGSRWLQGRACYAVLDGKFAANVTAAYSTGNPGWRNLSKSRGRAHVAQSNFGQRNGALLPLRGRGDGPRRRPALAKSRC